MKAQGFQGFFLPQNAFDHAGGLLLRLVIKMRIDVGRGRIIAVPQPELDQLHRHPAGGQQARAGVPELMEADMPQAVLFKQEAEVRRNEIGPVQLPQRIDTDIAVPIFTVAFGKQPPVFCLPGLLLLELLRDAGGSAAWSAGWR